MKRSSQKKPPQQTSQRPLTSFFYSKGKRKTPDKTPPEPRLEPRPASTGAVASEAQKEVGAPSQEAHLTDGSAVITLDDSPPAKKSTFFSPDHEKNKSSTRPAKRAKVERPATDQSGVSPQKTDDVPVECRASTQVPGRISARHQRFQKKLVTGPAFQDKSADGIVKQKYTPLELQVVEMKKKHPGVILIFEVGYKFRFFGEDAEIASAICNIFCYPARNFMSASIPVPRLHIYIRRLVAEGHKVGVVRQMETAALKAAGDNKYAPFTRKLTALYTRSTLEAGDKEDIGEGASAEPGTKLANGSWSNEGLSKYLVCLAEEEGMTQTDEVEIGVVAVETSTGDILYSQFRDGLMRGSLEAHLIYATPSELLVAQPVSNATQRLLGSFSQAVRGLKAETVPSGKLSTEAALMAVAAFYKTGKECCTGVDFEELPSLVLQALAYALEYLQQFGLEAVLRQACAFRKFSEANEMTLAPNALTQLEVLRNSCDGTERGSLLWLLDHTKTAMGGRLMRSWVAHPLRNVNMITERLDAVQELAVNDGEDNCLTGRMRHCLGRLPDLERGVTRMLHRTASPSELLQTLKAFSTLAADLGVQGTEDQANTPSVLLQRLLAAAASPEAGDAAREMLALIHEDAAEQNNKIGLFKSHQRFPKVFQQRQELSVCEDTLAGLLPALAKELRVPRLEFVSMQNQGDYLIEVDASRKDVPKEWEKISSTKKVNRFRPPEVTEAVRQLEMAKERLQAACEEAYTELLSSFSSQYMAFRSAASAIASLDSLQSLALVSGNAGYVRPVFVKPTESAQIHIEEGRHPVLDALMDNPYVPNDTHLAGNHSLAQLITGPNMGGKSSYIRQVALIAIMAQIGSWVPAAAVKLRAIDAVHTRMGASDNLAQGRSTFLEELSETSAILATATESSLVVIDELGRGTSTHDGLAIAHATMHYLLRRSIPLLFVTHYPKIAALQEEFPGKIEARHMSYLHQSPSDDDALDPNDQQLTALVPSALPKITFLFKLAPGIADRSFGLNVARMAHLPGTVLTRAAFKAQQMEEQALDTQKDEGNTDQKFQQSLLPAIRKLRAALTLPSET